jgi:5-methylcytosine-specific restriction endonuclease McrA
MRVCAVCGKSLAGKRPHAKFCTPLCKSKNTQRARDARSYKKNIEKIKIKRSQPEYKKYHNAKSKAYEAKRRSNAVGSFSPKEWDAIVKKQRGRCALCRHKSKLTADHVIPVSRGGSNYAFNIQGLCLPCNLAKWAHVPNEAVWSLFDKVAI